MNIVFCTQCSEGAKEGSDCTMLKVCFCPQHSLKFGSKTSPQWNAVLRAGKCETLKVGSSCLNKIEFFSTQRKNLLLCLENPQFLVCGQVWKELYTSHCVTSMSLFGAGLWLLAQAGPLGSISQRVGQWRSSFGSGSICGALVPPGPASLPGSLKALQQHKVWTPRSSGGADSGALFGLYFWCHSIFSFVLFLIWFL